jgi:hypothetical protein
MRTVVVVAAVLGLSACSLGSHESEPKPPRPVPLIAVSCERALLEMDDDAVAALEPIEAKEQEVKDFRNELRGPLRELRSVERTLKAAAAELKAFLSAHPETYLPSSLYYHWRGLRDAYQSAYAAYRQRVKKFRPLQRDFKAVVREENTLWKAVRRITKSYDKKLQGCVGPSPEIARVETNRIRSLEKFVEDVAGDIARRALFVRCETAGAWAIRDADVKHGDLLGYVLRGGRTIHLAPSICYTLHRLRYLKPKLDLSCLGHSRSVGAALCPPRAIEVVRAAVTVAHEAAHVAGEGSEKRAECFGLQTATLVAQRFGVPPSVSDQIAWYAWRFSEAPRSYQSPQCRDGRKLDLDPSSTSFP